MMSGGWNADSLVRLLVAASIESALLTVIVFLILLTIGRWIAPSCRVMLWMLPLMRLIVLVLPTVPAGFVSTVNPIVPNSMRVPLESTEAMLSIAGWPDPRERNLDAAPGSAPTANSPQPRSPIVGDVVPITSPNVRQPTDSIKPNDLTQQVRIIPTVVITLWLAGLIIGGLRWICASLALRRVLRHESESCHPVLQTMVEIAREQAGLLRSVRCVLTGDGLGPATCGIIRPTILVPRTLSRDLSREDLRLIIAHEIEHIRRCDSLFIAIGRLAVTLHWFNPIAHWVRRVMQREMEMAVDAATIDRIGPHRMDAYGDLLIRLVQHPIDSSCVIPMARSRSTLHRRITSLVHWRPTHRAHRAVGGAVIALLAVVGLCEFEIATAGDTVTPPQETAVQSSDDAAETTQTPANSAEGDNEMFRVSGRVVDDSGDPVPRARLFAEVYTNGARPNRVTSTANERGEFTITYPKPLAVSRLYHTWVYAEGYGVRVFGLPQRLRGDNTSEVTIRLPKLEAKEFQVRTPDGNPCANATVFPSYVSVPNGVFQADEPTGLSHPLPESLRPLLARATDREGRVRIEGIPIALLESIEVETTEYGRQRFRGIRGDQVRSVQLAKVGTILGRLNVPSPERYAGTLISITSPYDQGVARTQLDEHGMFEVPAMAEGKIQIYIDWKPGSETHPYLLERPIVRAGEVLYIGLDVRPTIPVRGTILAADTRSPLPNVSISLRTRNNNYVRFWNSVATDANGQFVSRIAVGEIDWHVFSGIVSPYEYPKLQSIWIADDAKSFEFPEILIPVMQPVTGRLIDAEGRGVSGRNVVLYTGSRRHVAGQATTNADGSFTMHVRNWDRYSKNWESRWYWAIRNQDQDSTIPPEFVRLELISADPDRLLLKHLGH